MKFETLKVSVEDMKEIERLIQSHPELGYETPREFVIAACFRNILRLLLP